MGYVRLAGIWVSVERFSTALTIEISLECSPSTVVKDERLKLTNFTIQNLAFVITFAGKFDHKRPLQ